MATDKKQPTIDNSLRESVALRIFIDKARGTMAGYDPEVVAEQAFAEGEAFCAVAQKIRNGATVPKTKQQLRREIPNVDVHLWDPVTDEPLFDDMGKPKMMEMPGDPDAHAPNLPDDHPVNQRYYKCLDRMKQGVTIKETKTEAVEAN